MAADKIIISGDIGAKLPEVVNPIPGGTVKKPEKPMVGGQKGWGRVRSTVPGTYTVQVVLPGGAVETLGAVTAVVPLSKAVDIAARFYVNLVDTPAGGG